MANSKSFMLFSPTDPDDNKGADSYSGWPEPMLADIINDRVRSFQTLLRATYADAFQPITTGGSGTAYTATGYQLLDDAPEGTVITLKMNVASGASPTLSFGGELAQNMIGYHGANLYANDLQSGHLYRFVRLASKKWQLVSGPPRIRPIYSAKPNSVNVTISNQANLVWGSTPINDYGIGAGGGGSASLTIPDGVKFVNVGMNLNINTVTGTSWQALFRIAKNANVIHSLYIPLVSTGATNWINMSTNVEVASSDILTVNLANLTGGNGTIGIVGADDNYCRITYLG